MTQQPNVASWGFWVVSALALIWNLVGLFAFASHISMSPDRLLEIPPAERALFEDQPGWVTTAFAVAVFAGALGSMGLLLRKTWAAPVFVLSLVGVLVQNVPTFIGGGAVAVFGPQAFALPIVVVAVSVFLIWFARLAVAKGWLG